MSDSEKSANGLPGACVVMRAFYVDAARRT